MTDPFACPTPLKPCACRQSAKYALGFICRRKGNRPDRAVDCEAAPAEERCKTCRLWGGGILSCLAGQQVMAEEELRLRKPRRVAKIPVGPRNNCGRENDHES